MKKVPLVFSGCLLGLAGAGNLVLDTLPLLSHLLSLTGLSLWIYFLLLHLFNWKETKQELTKPPILSGMATFPMAGMILSAYVFRVFPHLPLVAQGLWWFSFLLDLALIAGFIHQICLSWSEGSCYSKLDGSLCGDSSGSLNLSSCRHHRNCLCDLEFWISLDLLSLSAYL